MAAATHLYRRKAVYYWRRRLPPSLAEWFHKRHIFLSLRTRLAHHARRLVVLLDAKLEEVVTAVENGERHITPQQLDVLLGSVVSKHLEKLERLSAAAKSFESFDAEQAARDDRRAAWTYRLLHAQGASAFVRPADEVGMADAGLSPNDIEAVRDHLHMLRLNGLIPTRRDILANLLHDNGAPANAANLARAQDVYFRGIYIALSQADRRYGGEIVEAKEVVDQLFRSRLIAQPPNAKTAEIIPTAQPHQPAMSVMSVPEPALAEDKIDDRFGAMASLLVKKRVKSKRWSEKSRKQAEQTFMLLGKFMKEECGVERMRALKQKDLAALVTFFEAEIYKHYGKSEKDNNRSIAELRMIALTKSENLRGLEAGSLNRHLTFISQLLDFAESQGVDLDPRLKINKLRAADTSEERDRDERKKLSLESVVRLFQQAPFNNCLSWKHQHKEGAPGETLVFHGALYYIPMLIFYGGGRREEYCGLMIDDVILDNGPHPYLHIAKNKYRRIKNGQSKRNIVLHPELIRLGFLQYVAKIKALGYDLVFPDLFSPTTKSPLGNRFYKVFKPVLLSASITEEGLGAHAMRHAFGGILKKRDVSEEHRADLLGHAGKTETSERYCEATEIEKMYRIVCKMPRVTADLTAIAVNLPAWIVLKNVAPFSQPTRTKRT
ncbi:DUF6538 domain-containing protein [Tardiphaga sp.]|jgi:integrase|uniref:DUF6538 domain-containing protein n=1 Tax=Tardiphaga sp. TaxID=1926292 RepID=UPI0037DA1297